MFYAATLPMNFMKSLCLLTLFLSLTLSLSLSPTLSFSFLHHSSLSLSLPPSASPSLPPSATQKIEELLGVELADDIGEWVTDGVIPCQLVKKLHPQFMASYHSPAQGKVCVEQHTHTHTHTHRDTQTHTVYIGVPATCVHFNML